MPYITQDKRDRLDKHIEALAKKAMEVDASHIEGVLNYCITKLLLQCIPQTSYSEINRMVGMLECCKLEFYRRLAAPYEHSKAESNGDVYDRPPASSQVFKRMYSIGTEVSPGEYGMTDGPTPDVSEMIRVRGKEGDLLFELEGDRTVPLYRWNPSTGKWATIPATPS